MAVYIKKWKESGNYVLSVNSLMTEQQFDQNKLQKGQILFVKAPPYYEKEYPYVITSAGEKMVKATLRNSSVVKKSWTTGELRILFDTKIIRFAKENEL